MRIRVREARGISILDIKGRIDIDAAEIIEITGGFLKYGKSDILFNLNEVEQIDYNGLSILTIAYKNVINHNGRIKFCNVPIHVFNLLRAAHLDTIFEIYNSEKMAIMSFREAISQVEKKILRRRFKRLFIHINVKYYIPARPKRLYEGKLLNISGAGIYLQCKDTFPVKTTLNLLIKLPRISKTIEAPGMVIWNADREIQPHEYPGMGIQFTELSSDVQKKILDFIDKNISHRSGRGLYAE